MVDENTIKQEPEGTEGPPQAKPWWERIFNILGIHFPKGKQDKVHIGPRFFTILGGLALAVVLGMVGLVEYSTSPSFCNSCHIMKPYYDAWKTSTHNFVACVDCHYPPGLTEKLAGKVQAVSQVVKYVTRTYGTKPYAEIKDASCLQSECHSKRLIQGRTLFKRGIILPLPDSSGLPHDGDRAGLLHLPLQGYQGRTGGKPYRRLPVVPPVP
jgi:hypothetical protein